MGALTAEQQCVVFPRYTQMFKKNLVHLVKEECGIRLFGAALQILGQDPLSADCHLIAKACEGRGTNLFLVLSILCGRTNEEIDMLKKKWFDWKTEDIGILLGKELSGGVAQLIITLLQAREEAYDPAVHNREKMEADCQQLREAGVGTSGTNEKVIFKILGTAPAQYLKELNMCFAEKYGVTVAKSLEEDLSGSSKDAALFLMGIKMNPTEEIAKLIERACKGMGTDELLLSSILIRYHSMLPEIDAAHQKLYNQSVKQRVVDEASKDYEKLLVTIVESVGL